VAQLANMWPDSYIQSINPSINLDVLGILYECKYVLVNQKINKLISVDKLLEFYQFYQLIFKSWIAQNVIMWQYEYVRQIKLGIISQSIYESIK